tara:strand:- start:75434 stop:76063 length:630 start_codon:yes stop_codon:yes gene_type:complete
MLKKWFFSGLLIWLPIGVTLFVLSLIVGILDKSLDLVPAAYQPDALLGFHLPGLGVLLSIVIIFVTGMLMTNFFGRIVLGWGEKLLEHIPLVRTVYSASKQIMETMTNSTGESFRKVLLVEYPRKGMWSVAFQTNAGLEQAEKVSGQAMVTIFIPTTPNPTSGFLMLVPIADVVELDMNVEDAMKFVVSLGTVHSASAMPKIQKALPTA